MGAALLAALLAVLRVLLVVLFVASIALVALVIGVQVAFVAVIRRNKYLVTGKRSFF